MSQTAMLSKAEEELIRNNVEAARPLIAAEFGMKAYVREVHSAQGFTDNLPRVTIQFRGNAGNSIIVVNRAGWLLDQEIDVTFKPAPESTEPPPY